MYTKDQVEAVSLDELMAHLDCGTRADLVAAIAAACHQQNRAYCIMIGDDSQVHWADAPPWQKDSAMVGVELALVNPNPAISHESWLEHKKAGGWVYGEVKDEKAKTHPCMVAYGDLPEEQKLKDHLFISMAQQLGLVLGLIRLR